MYYKNQAKIHEFIGRKYLTFKRKSNKILRKNNKMLLLKKCQTGV